jgi:hypothetical protein
VLLLTMVMLGAGWFVFVRETGPIPRAYRRGLDFSLYYPVSLPAGYYVDKASFKREGDVLIYIIRRPGHKSAVVSQQALPTDGPVHEVPKGHMTVAGERNFMTAAGNVQIGLWGDKYVADIITNDSWIILNVTGYTADEAAAVAKSFTQLK